MRAQLSLSIHTHHTLCPPNKGLTCFTNLGICGNYFLQSWEARVLSLRTASISGREPKPLFKLLQAEVSRDIAILPLCCGTILLPWEKKKPPQNKRSKPSSWNLVMSNRNHWRLWVLSFWVSMGRKSPSLNKAACTGTCWVNFGIIAQGSLVIFLWGNKRSA